MSLLDELRSVLTHHHLHVTGQPQQGTAHLIEGHLKQLEAAAGDAEKATAEAHKVLDALYGALNAPAAEAPVVAAPAKAPAKKTAAAPAETDKA